METVLLIENDPTKLVAQALILRCLGYMVLEAGNRGEAWRVCSAHRGPIHLLVTQAVQGDDSTRNFVARLRLIHPQMRALFLSNSSSGELAEMPCEHAVLQIPFLTDDLANMITGLLNGAKIG